MAAAASAVAGAAGVLAGVVGLGGGTMIGPILLEFKIHPQVRKHACWLGQQLGDVCMSCKKSPAMPAWHSSTLRVLHTYPLTLGVLDTERRMHTSSWVFVGDGVRLHMLLLD